MLTILRWICVALPIAALFILFALVLESSSLQQCKNEAYTFPNVIAAFSGCFIEKTKDYITALSTVAIGTFTIVLAIIGIYQITDGRITQRAYLSVEPLGVHPWREKTKIEVVGHIGIRNVGRLPANQVCWFVDSQFSSDETFQPPGPGGLDGPIVVPPGSTARQGGPHKPDSDGSTFFYVWGIVEYSDGFRKRRWTKFCHRYNCAAFEDARGDGRKIDAIYGRYHQNGNSTDEG
jgi:hypothetical protein